MGKYHNYIILQIVLSVSFTTIAYAQRAVNSDEVYQAYSPGQYVLKQQEPQAVKSTPRLVATKNGQLVRTANGQLRRVRVVPIGSLGAGQRHQEVQVQPHQGLYTVEAPVQYAQTVPAVSTVRAQPTVQYHPQQLQYIQQQPAPQPQQYYVPRTQQSYTQPKSVPRLAAKPVKQVLGDENADEEYASDPNPQYNFSFDVKDDELTNYQNRQEERENGVIKGSYSVVDPDGYVRTVTYTADSKNGFQAKVVREPTDVKVKFPVPTPAPEQEQYNYRKPVLRSQYPQYAQHLYKQQQ